MEIPILLQKTERGRLLIWQQGLFTCFEGQCEAEQSILRLSVYGQGKEGYLGVMQPENGGLYLRRRLSRKEMEGFPRCPEYAAAAGEGRGNAEESEVQAQKNEKIPQTIERETATQAVEAEIIWYRRADGSLTGFDGNYRFLALPEDLRNKSSGIVLRRIEGKSYMIFRY